MHISWLGQTCVKLQTKNIDEEVSILIDAYKPNHGEFPRSFSPTIALFSRGSEGAASLSQNAFLVDTLGEFDLKQTMITAIPGPNGAVLFKIVTEGVNCLHLGGLQTKLSNEIVEQIGKVDILLVAVGGGQQTGSEMAAELAGAIEPRIVIPIGYQSDTDPKAEPLSNFVKAIGLKPETTDKKIIIKAKDLPHEETKLMVLEKNI